MWLIYRITNSITLAASPLQCRAGPWCWPRPFLPSSVKLPWEWRNSRIARAPVPRSLPPCHARVDAGFQRLDRAFRDGDCQVGEIGVRIAEDAQPQAGPERAWRGAACTSPCCISRLLSSTAPC